MMQRQARTPAPPDGVIGPRLPLTVLTLFGLAVMPFTQLRMGLFGVGEIIILVVAFNLFFLRGSAGLATPSLKVVRSFQVTFLSIMILSFILNTFNASANAYFAGGIFNLGAYAVSAITVAILVDARLHEKRSILTFFKQLYLLWGALFLILLLASFTADEIGGFTLRQWGRFMPLVTNQHQTAMLFCALPFIGVSFAILDNRKFHRLIFLGFSLAFAWMAVDSGADKAKLSLLCGAVFGVGAFLLSYRRRSTARKVDFSMITLVFVIAVIGTAVWGDWLYDQVTQAFDEADYRGGRRNIYGAAIQTWTEAPFVGGGPSKGVNLGFEMVDPHSTPFDALIKGGVIGLLVFLLFFIRLLGLSFFHPAMAAIVMSLLPYILGGDVLRRTVYWVAVVACFVVYDVLRARSAGAGDVTLDHSVPSNISGVSGA